MHIVVLDGYTLNPGDNPWEPFTALGSLTVYERSGADELLHRAADADILLTNKTPIQEAALAQLPRLKAIGVLATGYDIVDVAAASARNIPVFNAAAYGVDSVAQLTFSLLLELCRHTAVHDASVRSGTWASCPDWCYWLSPQQELAGKTMGLIGFGNNGRKVGEIAHAFGMPVIAYSWPPTTAPSWGPFRFVERETLFCEADVISLHCPLTAETRHIINAASIALMQVGTIIINTARGPLLDEAAVAAALCSGHLGGLGADVLTHEPPQADSPLLHCPNTLITPHIAWASLNARRAIMRIVAGHIKAFCEGTSHHAVNADKLHRQ